LQVWVLPLNADMGPVEPCPHSLRSSISATALLHSLYQQHKCYWARQDRLSSVGGHVPVLSVCTQWSFVVPQRVTDCMCCIAVNVINLLFWCDCYLRVWALPLNADMEPDEPCPHSLRSAPAPLSSLYQEPKCYRATQHRLSRAGCHVPVSSVCT
jgi:hypothetical protein